MYTLLARYRTGDWLRRFDIEAFSAYEACRDFDTSDVSDYWERVSGASISTPLNS